MAIAADILFILWILWNAVDEGGQGETPVGIASLLGLIVLLGLNIGLLISRRT